MHTNKLTGFLFLGGLLLCSCRTIQPPIVTVEVTRIVREIVVVTTALPDQHITNMKREITFRLHEIRTFLDQVPMTNRSLYDATERIVAHGVGISNEFKDWELRALLFELVQFTPPENQSYIQNIMDLFEELTQFGPQAPFSDGELADPEKVQLARDKFGQIEREWQLFLRQSG